MMLKKLSCLVCFCIALSATSFAQNNRVCATYEYNQRLQSIYPAYANKRMETENRLLSENFSSKIKTTASPILIPVVVHIIYHTLEQNLSDDKIVSQIDALNEDYAITNANIVQVPSVWANLVGDAGIRFKLARKDENGNATTGITRTLTSKTFFTTDNAMKYDTAGGHDAWNSDYFLNIWVCNMDNGAFRILGYAQLPNAGPKETDGVVVNYVAFGRVESPITTQYNLGRTLTHEVGHWLNLLHIWGDDGGGCSGSDNVNDTPNQGKETFGCPAYPKTDACANVDGSMFMNYMDYTDDKCMMLFTFGQRQRMDNALAVYRNSILTAASYTVPVSQLTLDARIASLTSPSGLICEKNVIPTVTVENSGTDIISSFTIDYGLDSLTTEAFDWAGTLTPGNSIDITLPEIIVSDDLHTFISRIRSVNNSIDEFPLDNFKTRSFLFAPEKYGCKIYPETPLIVVSPNPASTILKIETTYKTAQKATLGIYNILGKRVFAEEFINSSGEILNIDVNGLAAGIYFVQVKTFNKGSGLKFMVTH